MSGDDDTVLLAAVQKAEGALVKKGHLANSNDKKMKIQVMKVKKSNI